MLVKSYKDVDYCGQLHTCGKSYWLLHPEPVVKDSWQNDNAQRFLVVPIQKIGLQGVVPVFSYPRHIVSTCYTIEYSYTDDKIRVVDLDNYSVEMRQEVHIEPFEDLGALEELFGEKA